MAQTYKKEYLLDLFNKYEGRYKKLPTRREMHKEFGVREDPFCRVFGSWEEAKIAYKATKVSTEGLLDLDTYLDEDKLYGAMIGAEHAQEDIENIFSKYTDFKILSLSDIELPYANIKMINTAVHEAIDKGAEVCVLNGDITHSDFFSKHAKHTYVSPQEEYSQLEQLVAWLSARFTYVVLVSGNHDRMVRRYCQRVIPQFESMQFLVKDDLLDIVASKYENVLYASNWWVKIKDVIYMHPDGFTVLPMRTPINSSKIIQKLGVDASAYVQGHCFSSDTELLTVDGWKNYTELKKGSVVATMNKETKAIEFQPVQEKYVYDSYDKVVHFKSNSMDHLVTEDHGMVSEHRTSGELAFPKAKDWTYESQVIVSGVCEERVDLPGWTDDEIRLLVWCVTDGCCENDKFWRWHLKKQRKIDALSELLDRMGIGYSKNLQKAGTTKIRIGVLPSKYVKLIENKFYGLSSRQANVLLETWSITDGTRIKEGTWQLQTSVKHHADLLQALAVVSGNKAITTSNKDNTMHYVAVRQGVRTTRFIAKHNNGTISYSGDVYCVSVPNGTLLARRNGKVMITQNTHKVGEYTEGSHVFYETGCSCLPQDYYMSRGSIRWENAYNIIDIKNGKFNYNESRNYKWRN